MTDFKHIIEPERIGLWVAVTFIVAILALTTAAIAIKRNNELAYFTQVEFLILNKKIEKLHSTAKAPAPAPATEAAPEAAAK